MAIKLEKELLKKLLSKLESDKVKIESQVKELKKDDPFLDPEHVSDNAAVDTDVREQVGHDTIEAEIKDLEMKLINVNHAIQKIAKDKYGFCEKCGKSIPVARLEILPEARFCVECEQKLRR